MTEPSGVRGHRLRRLGIAAAALAATMGLAACGSSGTSRSSSPSAGAPSGASQSTPSAPSKLTAVNFAQAAAIDHGVIFAALEKGYFLNRGVKANVKLYPTGKEIINQIASGNAQFGICDAGVAMTAIATGVPIKIVALDHGNATVTSYSNNQAIIAGPKTGIPAGDIKALKGKKIGLPMGTAPQVYLDALLSANGLSESDVHLQNMQPADMISALQQGSIDAFVTFEPTPALALEKIPGSVLVKQGGAPGVYAPGGLIASSSWIASHPNATKAVLAAFAQSEQLARQDPTEIATIDTHWINNLPVPVAETAIKALNFDPRLSTNALKAFKTYTVPFLVKYSGLKPGFDPGTAIDASYLAAVEKQYPQYFNDLPPLPAGAQEMG